MLKHQAFYRAFSLLAILTIASKLLGFIREAIIASYFGATLVADMIYVALIIPTIAFTVIGTAIQGHLLPLYMEEKENKNTNIHFQRYSGLIITLTLILLIVLFIFIKPIVSLVAPGFSAEQINDTSWLAIIMLPILLIMTFNSLTQVIYHSHDHFTPPAMGPVINNIVTIFTIFILYPTLHLYSVAVAILIGSFTQFLYQIVGLKDKRSLLFNWDYRENIKYLNRLKPIIPILIAAIALQLNLVVDRVVASFLSSGGISALNYSYRLLWIPLSVLLIPISTIYYPKLTRSLQNRDITQYKEQLTMGLRIIIILALPILFVMCFESTNLIELVYERGAFDQEATSRTSGAFLFYSIGLLFFATREYFVHHFYAHKDYKTVMYGSILGVFINICLSVALAFYIGINGIALATSASMFVQTLYYYWFIRKGYINLKLSIIVKAGLAVTLIVLSLLLIKPYYESIHIISIALTTTISFVLCYFILKKEVVYVVKQMKGS